MHEINNTNFRMQLGSTFNKVAKRGELLIIKIFKEYYNQTKILLPTTLG